MLTQSRRRLLKTIATVGVSTVLTAGLALTAFADSSIGTNISTSSGGTITSAGLLTGSLGLTVTGATTSLNASSNFGTNINTGTSSGALALGGGSGTVAVNSSDWDIDATGVMTGIGAVTADGLVTVARSISADSGTTNNWESLTFTTPADTTGTNTHQGLNVTTTVGNATAGTNTANMINLAAVTGDAQVTLNAIKIGALTGTAAAESAINIGDGWDKGITGATYTIDGTTALTIGAGAGTIAVNSSDWDIDATGVMTGIGAITADGLVTGSLGLTVTGATVSLNASSNFGTNINTGTSSGALALGGGSGTVAVNSSDWDIDATGVMTGIGAVTADGLVTIARSISADSGTTNNWESLTFTTPADTAGTNVHQGLNVTSTVGNATGGTNTANMINLAAVTGDAQVTLNAIKIGALTGTGAVESAINIGDGWDTGITGATYTIDGTTALTIGAGGGTIAINSSDWDISATGVMTGIGAITSDGAVTANAYNVTNGSAFSAANPTPTKANLQAASFWPVNTATNAVDVDIPAMDAADVGRHLTFAVTTGHATQALTVTAGAGMTVVQQAATNDNAADHTTAEDAGDYIDCLVTSTATATCVTYAKD